MEVKMDKHTEKVNDIEICTAPKGVLQYTHEVMEMSEYDKNLFHKVYREISEQLGIETALTIDRKSTRLNSSHTDSSRMPSSA